MGDLSDELESNAKISNFVCSGPKSYCLEIRCRQSNAVLRMQLRMKGMRHTERNLETVGGVTVFFLCSVLLFERCKCFSCVQINFDSLREAVLNGITTAADEVQFKRNYKKGTVRTVSMVKRFGCTFTKRMRLGRVRTLPFGYRPTASEMLAWRVAGLTLLDNDDADDVVDADECT